MDLVSALDGWMIDTGIEPDKLDSDPIEDKRTQLDWIDELAL